MRARPTPIRISRRTRNVIIVLGLLALVGLMWAESYDVVADEEVAESAAQRLSALD